MGKILSKIFKNVLDKIKRDIEAMDRQVEEAPNRDRKERIRLVYYASCFRYLRNADLL